MKYHIVRCLVYFLLFSFLSLNVAMALDGGDVITTSITEVPYCDSRCSRGLAFKFSFSEGSSIVSESIGTLTDGTEYSRELDIDFQENVILCESIDTNIDSMYRVIGIVGSRRISIYLIQKGVVPSDFIISDIKFISTGNTGNLYVSYDTQAYYTVTGENQMASYDATLCDDLECKININSLSVSGTREWGLT